MSREITNEWNDNLQSIEYDDMHGEIEYTIDDDAQSRVLSLITDTLFLDYATTGVTKDDIDAILADAEKLIAFRAIMFDVAFRAIIFMSQPDAHIDIIERHI